MEDSIQILNLSSPEVIVIGDDTYDYEDRDGDIEVIEINKVKVIDNKPMPEFTEARASTSAAVKLKATSATAAHLNRIKRPARSSLTDRRVVSPTDEIFGVVSSQDDETLLLAEPEAVEMQYQNPKPSSSKSAAVNTNTGDDSDLSVIEVIPAGSGSGTVKPFPGPKRFAPNPVFKPRARGAAATSTPVSSKKAKLRANASVSSASKLSKRALKRKTLRERLEKQRLQLHFKKSMHKNNPRKESLIQQSLRNLSNNIDTSVASTSIRSGNSSPRKRVRKSLKRLRNSDTFVPAVTAGTSSKNYSRFFGNTRGSLSPAGGRNRGGRGRGFGNRSRDDKSNQENIVSSSNTGTGPDADAPSASLHTSWDYKPVEYEQGQHPHLQQPDSSSAFAPVSRNLDYLPPLPFSDLQAGSSRAGAEASKYDESWKVGSSRGRGRGARGRWRRGDGTSSIGFGCYGFEAGVARNFELAPARFSPPPPITYNVDNLLCNTFVAGAVSSSASTSASSSKTAKANNIEAKASYNPIAVLSQASQQQEPPKLALSAFGENLFAPTTSRQKPGTLRPIVIDGSNVAMAHGNNKLFSCRGIRVCVDYFKARGHTTIIAFVPHFKSRGYQTVDPDVLEQLEAEGIVKTTPGRTVDGIRISAYDDRFIVQSAAQIGGIIISNDNFRDLYHQEPSWRDTIHRRVLQYVWISPDMIMFPDDPLGRGGPRLNEILRF